MALIVEDGTGMDDAEAYVSVADADAYHTAYGAPAPWTSATTAAKETALREATRALDATYRLLWRGDRAHETQALAWPRVWAFDDDGFAIGKDSVPKAVRDATAVLALKIVEGDEPLADVEEPGALIEKSVKVGPIEKTSRWASGGVEQQKQFTLVAKLLSGVVLSGARVVRG